MAMSFGLIGTGHWARTTHGPALAEHAGTELVGVWGRSAQRATSLADELGTTAFADLDALFAEVDAVAVAVPPDVQPELAVRAARAGRHLLLDKPLALSVAAADELVAAVDEAGVRNLVFFTMRFVRSVATWLDALPPPDVIRSGRVRHHTSIYDPGNPYGASAWRRQHGALWDIGPHALSVLLPALGPVVQVRALRGRDDEIELITKHEDGAVGSISLSLTSPPEDRSAETVIYGNDQRWVLPEADDSPASAFGRMIDALLAPPVGPWSHTCDVHFAREVTRVLATARDSAR